MTANRGTRITRWQSLAFILAAAVALPLSRHDVGAAPGALDPSFGDGGRVVVSSPGVDDSIEALARQSDGRIVAVGRWSTPPAGGGRAAVDILVMRFDSDGTLDSTFGSGGIVRTDFDGSSEEARAVAIQPDGRIVVAGGALQFERPARSVLVRYNHDGTLDPTFGNNGVLLTDFPYYTDGLLLQPDGAIVVAGMWFDRSTGTGGDFALTRYTADGLVDVTFGDAGRVVTDFATAPTGSDDYPWDMALQDDGRIVVLGLDTSFTGDFVLARYLPDGSLDPSFGVGGKVFTEINNNTAVARALAIQPDGKLIAAGYAERAPTYQHDFYLVRYNPDGSIDPTFDGDGKLATDFGDSRDRAHAIAIDGVGRILVAGLTNIPGFDTIQGFALVRYNADGTLDASFGTDGRIRTDFPAGDGTSDAGANAILLQPDGKIVAAGGAGTAYFTPDEDAALARYDGGIPHASVFFLHAVDAPPPSDALAMTPAPPSAQPLTVDVPSVTWLSVPPVNGEYPAGATFRFVTPCTQSSGLGKTVRLASTDLDGGDERLLGTAQSAPTCGRTETIVIPVTTPVTLTNRRLKLTVSSPAGVHLQLGPRTFVSATAFEGEPQP